ncbi:uncharacterized protein L201_003004 [Kwoniella dendrophila CBS 6074]|uniref:TauD/TfdA-like domain-containing protein n=1 Tax=Kwoniella dendrophila CBS 6074 TaxID=1295534 RepID=A0AAX4JU48_9TREE
MAALVQAPISAITDGLKSLGVIDNIKGNNTNSKESNNENAIERTYGYFNNTKKQVISEEEKKINSYVKQRRIYGTSYEPSLEWWNSNQKDYVKPENDPLPEGFPAQVESKALWDGKVLINQPEKWLYTFTPSDIQAIEDAYNHFLSLNLLKDDLSQETFPISKDTDLFKALSTAKSEINHGLGFRVLRGLPVDEWKREKQLTIFAGISSYIGGERIKQGNQNVVHLRDITNLEVDKRPAITVKGQTSGNQVYHNDGSAGIIGLITLGVAETGGLSQLGSVARTYNELATTRRDIVRELANDDWKNKVYPDGKALIFAVENDQVISSYSRRPFFGFYEADADVPELSVEKHLALDAIHFTAEKFGLDLDLQKGDLEYFNNLTVFHARTSSEDSEKNARHLVRIWLQNPEQPLPDNLRAEYERLNAGKAKVWPLEAWDSTDAYDHLKSVNEVNKESDVAY